jgi:phenylacetic acid degradation operon negative regulatory protein
MSTRNDEVLLERPLTARSVVASLLLGMRPPRLSAARLVRWCSLFGIAEGTARVALSRMVDRGELVASDGVYELAGRVRARQPAQDWSLAPALDPWDGEWWIAVVGAGPRDARARGGLRDAARRVRLAELREGVWTRPANLPRAAAPAEAWAVIDRQCAWWTARPDGDARRLADDLFAPRAWAARAAILADRLRGHCDALARGGEDALASGFVAGAAALAHVRADPLLPDPLCPVPWPGDDLRTAYHAYQAAFAAAVRDWFRRT